MNTTTHQMVTPYLIQRATILKTPREFPRPFGRLVEFDYMGSAEFEFGALYESRRRFTENKQDLKTTLVPTILDDQNRPLRIVHTFKTDEEMEVYLNWIEFWWTGHGNFPTKQQADAAKTHRLKERSYFHKNRSDYEKKINLWWDIENQVIWSFEKKFIKHDLLTVLFTEE